MASPVLVGEFRALLQDMHEAWDALPPPAALGISDLSIAEMAEAEAVAVTHGWMARIVRSGEAVRLLVDHGYTVEAAPTIRLMIEHAIALWWIVDQRGVALQVLVRVRGKSARTFQEAQALGWHIEGDEAQELLQDLIDEETDQETVTFDYLKTTAAQAKRYGLGALYQAWLLETGNSHARIDSARPYYRQDPASQTIALLREPVDTGSEPDAAIVSVTHTALVAYNQLLSTHPLDDQLRDWQTIFERLAERLAAEISEQRRARDESS